MKLLIDNQLPLSLAIYLRTLGHQCAHVLEVGLDDADDLVIWKQAHRDGQIVVSKDEDFIFLANHPGDTGRVLWVRLGNCRNATLIDAFDRLLDGIVQAFDAGQRIVEIR